jgi:rhodanese-related sulfurtransferase
MNTNKRITASEVKKALDAGTRVSLIDVRTPAEFESAHIDGSVLMPLDQVDCAAVKAAAEGAALRVLVCQSGMRAEKAAAKLAAGGDPGFVVLEGGVGAWGRAGMPLIRGKFVLPLERQVMTTAGFLVLLGVTLGWQVHPGYFGLSAFVGVGLMVAGLTGFCPMAILMARMPWNQRGASCGGGGCCSR